MQNEVTSKFIRFIRQKRELSNTTVRELAEAIGKSYSYVSHLENGRIKTIGYDTALNLLAYLDKKSFSITGKDYPENVPELEHFLSKNFYIHPDSYWEQREREEVERKGRKLANLNAVWSEITSYLDVEHQYLLDFMLNIFKLISNSFSKIPHLDTVFELIKIIKAQSDKASSTFDTSELPILTDLKLLISKHRKEDD